MWFLKPCQPSHSTVAVFDSPAIIPIQAPLQQSLMRSPWHLLYFSGWRLALAQLKPVAVVAAKLRAVPTWSNLAPEKLSLAHSNISCVVKSAI